MGKNSPENVTVVIGAGSIGQAIARRVNRATTEKEI